MKSVTFKIHDSDLKNILNNKVSFWVFAFVFPLLFATCEKEADKLTGNNKVILATTTVTNQGYFTLNVTSSISQIGGQTIEDHGFCFSITPNPDLNASVKSLGKRTEPGDFSAELTNLEDNKKYYMRAFATITGGTVYAEQKEIITLKTGKPCISTNALSNISLISAVCGGKIESDSGYAVTTSGICWDTDNQFNESQCLGKATNTSGSTNFSLNITGLTDGTTYYVKAYATNQKGTSYGAIRTFSTIPVTVPAVSTKAVPNPTAISAIGGGDVTYDGNATVTARGVCWNTTGNPNLQDCLGFTVDGQGIGSFNSSITGLNPSTDYYVRAYATNEKGTGYGMALIFRTLAIAAPLVSTNTITYLTDNSATGGGNVTHDGNATITARGVVWNTTGDPTLHNNIGFTINGQGLGSFTSNITGLNPSTDYYVRAYATNSAGTSYGNQVSFQTNFAIGQSYGGGIIFYVDASGQHGLIAATSNQENSAWGCVGTFLGGTYTVIGAGQSNTTVITNGCGATDIAARVCIDLVLNDYDDWFLPSKDELNLMYLKRDIIGGFINSAYWSSSESSADGSWYQSFSDGVQGNYGHKNDLNYIRAIRAF